MSCLRFDCPRLLIGGLLRRNTVPPPLPASISTVPPFVVYVLRISTPVEFMRRVLGVHRLADSFDFSTATVDLIPTVPVGIDEST